MKVERLDYKEKPEQIVDAEVDCIWVQTHPSKEGKIPSKVLQWLDWKMRGQLLEFLKSSSSKPSIPTFFPSMKKVKAPYLALETLPNDWEVFFKNSEGLRLKKVLFVCEDPTKQKETYQYLKQRKSTYPEMVFFLSEEES